MRKDKQNPQKQMQQKSKPQRFFLFFQELAHITSLLCMLQEYKLEQSSQSKEVSKERRLYWNTAEDHW